MTNPIRHPLKRCVGAKNPSKSTLNPVKNKGVCTVKVHTPFVSNPCLVTAIVFVSQNLFYGQLPAGAPFFARSPARGDFAARKGCFCPCTVQGASQRGHSLSQKRMAPLKPQEKGLDWQSRARMTFVPPEWKCLHGGIASLAANGSARRFASAPIIRCCAAVGGSAALRMRHTPCGCRSAYLVGVQPNFRLPPVSTMRRAQQCRYFASSLPPCYRHSRLTIVRRG